MEHSSCEDYPLPSGIKQGASYSFQVDLFEDDDRTVPLDLTGAEFRFRVRKSFDMDTELLVLDNATNGGIDLRTSTEFDPTLHVAVVSITPTQAASLPCGCWLYDFEYELVGDVVPLLSGSVQVRAEV